MQEAQQEAAAEQPLTYTRAQVARHLQVRETTVTRMVERGEFLVPDFFVGGRQPRWSRARVHDWFAGHASEARADVG